MGAKEAIQAANENDYAGFKRAVTEMIDAKAAKEFKKVEAAATQELAAKLIKVNV